MTRWTKTGICLGLGVGTLMGACSEGPVDGRVDQNPVRDEALPSPESSKTIVFGVYTTDTAKDAVAKFRPLLNSLENDLSTHFGYPVSVVTNVYGDYDDGLDAIVNGEVDITRLGPASFVLAQKREPGVNLIAMETYKKAKTFHGIICVHSDSDIESIDDITGRSFAFGDENSTIGRYLSQQLLMQHGIYSADLTSFEYLGKHDKVGYMVGAGQFDAGALEESTFKKLQEKGEPIRELARFPNVTKPWVARSGLDEELIEAIQKSLLAQEDPAVLAAVGKSGFVVATDEDYAPIKKSIDSNVGFVRSKTAVVVEEPSTTEG